MGYFKLTFITLLLMTTELVSQNEAITSQKGVFIILQQYHRKADETDAFNNYKDYFAGLGYVQNKIFALGINIGVEGTDVDESIVVVQESYISLYLFHLGIYPYNTFITIDASYRTSHHDPDDYGDFDVKSKKVGFSAFKSYRLSNSATLIPKASLSYLFNLVTPDEAGDDRGTKRQIELSCCFKLQSVVGIGIGIKPKIQFFKVIDTSDWSTLNRHRPIYGLDLIFNVQSRTD